jgi:hypothetical protein
VRQQLFQADVESRNLLLKIEVALRQIRPLLVIPGAAADHHADVEVGAQVEFLGILFQAVRLAQVGVESTQAHDGLQSLIAHLPLELGGTYLNPALAIPSIALVKECPLYTIVMQASLHCSAGAPRSKPGAALTAMLPSRVLREIMSVIFLC